MQKFLKSILNQCLNILESDVGSILILDKYKNDIVVKVARGRNENSILGKRVRLGEGVSGFVALNKEPLLVEDVRKDTSISKRCHADKYKTSSFLSVPLLSDGRLMGVINITEKTNGQPFSIKELSFVCAIASSAAEAVEKMILNEHLEKQLKCFKNSTAVTRFTSSVAHELNNPLDGIMRYTRLCQEHLDDREILKEYLFDIQFGLKRISEIIRTMQEFSFAGDRKHNPIIRKEEDVNSLLKKSTSFYRKQSMCRSIRIDLELSEGLPKVQDFGLSQVFINLINNAFDSIGRNGRLLIKSYFENDKIFIEFIDSGCGIDESIKTKIFEPFFSTKVKGKGLGLAIVKEILTCYGGEYSVENVMHGGAKFKISIPRGG